MAARSNTSASRAIKTVAATSPAGSLEQEEALVGPTFDAELYAANYTDVAGDAPALLRHFCRQGWREGRNPNRAFDTAAYLLAHPDVNAHGINPYSHYLLSGQAEGRAVTRAAMPNKVAEQAFGRPVGDWVALLRPEVDVPFYVASLGFDPGSQLDPVAHFAYRGWLEGRDPNPQFQVGAALAANPGLRQSRLNPLLHALLVRPPATTQFGRGGALQTTRFTLAELAAETLPALRTKPVAGVSFADPVRQRVAQHLDRDFYLAAYPDVARHGADPVAHYCDCGWAEGRNPTASFNTAYYLSANPDVAGQQVNPFWHYLVSGQAEGRLPERPGCHQRRVIEQARSPDKSTSASHRPELASVLSAAQLEALLRPVLEASAGLALSVGHDRYVTVTGGLQLFLCDEQAKFGREGVSYLNISPFQPLLRLAEDKQPGIMLSLLLDGTLLGVAAAEDLATALGRLRRRPGQRRLFLIHCLLGHSMPALRALQRASGSTEDHFWLHDYSSVCAGYNLLRNDVAFCGAPPADSMACRVCVYGKGRAKHLAAVRELFAAIPFHVVAPSAAALDTWKAAGLPHRSAIVHAHCRLLAEPALAAARDGPIRVALLGYAKPNKGWPIWQSLVARCSQSADYRWFHLGSPDAAADLPGVEHHDVTTTRHQPDAMVAAVARLQIDLVAMLSPWPETFSYATFEAFAGGADVACLSGSGNVADMVLRHGRGVVAADAQALVEFFASGEAVRYAGLARSTGTPRGRLLHEGTTATLPDRVDG